MSRWLTAAAVLGCWGCAFTLDGPDPNRPRNRVPRCDTSKGLVALDGVMATALGVVALAVTSEGEPAGALLPLGLGALYLASAVSGNRATDKCRAAIDDYSQTYGDERMVLDDGSEGPPLDDDADARRGNRTAGQGRQSNPQQPYPQQPYPQQPYPQQPYPQQPSPQQPYLEPQNPVVPPRVQPPVPQPQQPTKPTKQPKAAPTPQDDEGDWTDFWREVP